MSQNTATVDLSGPMAHDMAQCLFDTLGMATESVTEVEITFHIDGGADTTVTVEANGDVAGKTVAQMIGSVDWESSTVDSISVSLTEEDREPANDSEADDGSDDGKSDAVYTPPVEPATNDIDPLETQFPRDDPGRLSAGTVLHVMASSLYGWFESPNSHSDWFTSREAAEIVPDDWDLSKVRSTISRLMLERGLLVRRRADRDGPGVEYEYALTDELLKEVERLDGE